MDTKEWMLKYLAKDREKRKECIIGILLILGGIFFIVIDFGEKFFILIGFFIMAGGLTNLLQTLNGKRGTEVKEWMDRMDRAGKLQAVFNDFQNARDYFGGQLRMGDIWCFGEGVLVPTAYEDIVRVYQRINKINGSEAFRCLCAETCRGDIKVICYLPVKGKGDEELNRVLSALVSKKPNIQIGYIK